MSYVNHGTTITVDEDLLPHLARALKDYRRAYSLTHENYDRRILQLETELDEAATEYVTTEQPSYLTSAQAATVLCVGTRQITKIAERLGGIKQGTRWFFPRDLVLRYVNKIAAVPV